jgi:hypothetical protein
MLKEGTNVRLRLLLPMEMEMLPLELELPLSDVEELVRGAEHANTMPVNRTTAKKRIARLTLGNRIGELPFHH